MERSRRRSVTTAAIRVRSSSRASRCSYRASSAAISAASSERSTAAAATRRSSSARSGGPGRHGVAPWFPWCIAGCPSRWDARAAAIAWSASSSTTTATTASSATTASPRAVHHEPLTTWATWPTSSAASSATTAPPRAAHLEPGIDRRVSCSSATTAPPRAAHLEPGIEQTGRAGHAGAVRAPRPARAAVRAPRPTRAAVRAPRPTRATAEVMPCAGRGCRRLGEPPELLGDIALRRDGARRRPSIRRECRATVGVP